MITTKSIFLAQREQIGVKSMAVSKKGFGGPSDPQVEAPPAPFRTRRP
jgi:hypothetical protein